MYEIHLYDVIDYFNSDTDSDCELILRAYVDATLIKEKCCEAEIFVFRYCRRT